MRSGMRDLWVGVFSRICLLAGRACIGRIAVMHFGRSISTHSWNYVIGEPPMKGLYSILNKIMTRVSEFLRSKPKTFSGLKWVCYCRRE